MNSVLCTWEKEEQDSEEEQRKQASGKSRPLHPFLQETMYDPGVWFD